MKFEAPARAQEGHTALHLAARQGLTDCMQLLLVAGARQDLKNQVRGALENELSR